MFGDDVRVRVRVRIRVRVRVRVGVKGYLSFGYRGHDFGIFFG